MSRAMIATRMPEMKMMMTPERLAGDSSDGKQRRMYSSAATLHRYMNFKVEPLYWWYVTSTG